MLLVTDAHVEGAVNANALPADVVIHRSRSLDVSLVGQVGGHRFGRIDARCCSLSRLLLKLLLTLFEIRKALHQHLVLIAKLLGLSLDIRKLIGVTCRREGKHSHRR